MSEKTLKQTFKQATKEQQRQMIQLIGLKLADSFVLAQY
jgi:hypothetical protein